MIFYSKEKTLLENKHLHMYIRINFNICLYILQILNINTFYFNLLYRIHCNFFPLHICNFLSWQAENRLLLILSGLPWWLSGKESICQCRRNRFDLWVGKIPWRRKWQPAPAFLLGKSHGQKSLAGYRDAGDRRQRSHGIAKGSDKTLRLNNNNIIFSVFVYVIFHIHGNNVPSLWPSDHVPSPSPEVSPVRLLKLQHSTPTIHVVLVCCRHYHSLKYVCPQRWPHCTAQPDGCYHAHAQDPSRPVPAYGTWHQTTTTIRPQLPKVPFEPYSLPQTHLLSPFASACNTMPLLTLFPTPSFLGLLSDCPDCCCAQSPLQWHALHSIWFVFYFFSNISAFYFIFFSIYVY